MGGLSPTVPWSAPVLTAAHLRTGGLRKWPDTKVVTILVQGLIAALFAYLVLYLGDNRYKA